MNLHLETTSEKMRNVAKLIYNNCDKDFYLAGGTALALEIGHRKSIDLDYFIAKPINTLKLTENLKEVFQDLSFYVSFEEKNTLWCQIDGVKVSFISRFDRLSLPVIEEEYFRLASLRDIVLMKLSTICFREEYKDYFDLACLSKITDSRSWFYWWQDIYPNVDVTSFIIALSAVEKVLQMPLEILNEYKSINVSSIIKNVEVEITKIVKET
ncbi:MAG: nucleotidyl transferase AbiEii/AbiGii toxin family protein [Candidatus Parcubacteria bacterium]|nr:nucleotidyl transferase AbiEii/AbiGii toxin family protein [Candidatus Parcubacteria bacterium]